MTIYTTSCSALTKTTLSTPLFYHQRFDSNIFSNFGKLQVSIWKMFVDKNSFKKNHFHYLYPNSMKADKVKGESIGL